MQTVVCDCFGCCKRLNGCNGLPATLPGGWLQSVSTEMDPEPTTCCGELLLLLWVLGVVPFALAQYETDRRPGN